MRIIDYYNIAAILLETILVLSVLTAWLRSRRKGASAAPADSGSCGREKNCPAVSFPVAGEKGCPASRRRGFFSSLDALLTGKLFVPAATLLLFLGAFLRMWNLTGLPDGLQQDEASIGYEAFCLANYGIDRNGYHWPVYPITWGSGGGSPIMIYLNVLTTKLFGSRIWSIRIVPAFLGVMTLLLFFLLLKKSFGRRTALTGLAVLALTPWHIILSRWSLDSNTMPFWQMLALYTLVQAVTGAPSRNAGSRHTGADTSSHCTAANHVRSGGPAGERDLSCKKNRKSSRRQTLLYLLAAFFFGVCLYSYGSANVVVPLTLLFVCVRLLRTGRIRIGQLAGCFAVFVLTCLPLALFYAVNFFGFPEIASDWISFPKFTSSHFGSVFVAFDRTLPRTLLHNLKDLVLMLTVGIPGEVSWNAMPGYWTLYCFTFPVTFAGILFGRRATAAESPAERAAGDVFRAALFAALLFSLFIQQDINRDVLLFLPLVYWYVMGLRFLFAAGKQSFAAISRGTGNASGPDSDSPTASARTAEKPVPAARTESAVCAVPTLLSLLLLFAGFASFAKDYYGGGYNEVAASDFMPGYGDAMVYATKLAEKKGETSIVYSTYDLVASPFMLTLYYTKYDPYDFMDTVVYKDPEAEFRVASSFGRYVFGLPAKSSSNDPAGGSADDAFPSGGSADSADDGSADNASLDLSLLQTPEYEDDIFVLTTAQAQAFDDADYDKTVFRDRFVVVVRNTD